LWSFVCGVLQAAQQWEEVVVVVVGEVVVAAVVASCWSSVLRFSIAFVFPSFAALVHHSRADAFD
jgi:hypothetical protein